MIKIITGFRDDQYFIINDEEAHKAYYLFENPEARTIFSNGVALIGKNIQGIEPAYNETMGWNPTHKLDDDDWNQIRRNGVAEKLRNTLSLAKEIAQIAEINPEVLKLPLSEVKTNLQLK
jgi:hypothetical protein